MLVCKNAFVTVWKVLWNKNNNKSTLLFPLSAHACAKYNNNACVTLQCVHSTIVWVTHTHTHMYTCTFTHVHIHTHTCTHTYTYTHTYTHHIYTHVHTYTHLHTYIHTQRHTTRVMYSCYIYVCVCMYMCVTYLIKNYLCILYNTMDWMLWSTKLHCKNKMYIPH